MLKRNLKLNNSLLHIAFEKWALENPLLTALVHKDKVMLYGEVNSKANQLANYLIDRGVTKGSIIGLHFNTSMEQIISLLAILKSGATYLPLDISYPKERLQLMLDDSKCDFVLTEIEDCNIVFSNNKKIIWDNIPFNNYPSDKPICSIQDSSLCYVMYTSGSTGKPKGVMIEHQNAYNTVSQMQDIYLIKQNDCLLLNTPLGFDPSVWQIFWPLSHGGTIILSEDIQDVKKLFKIINDHKLKVFHAGPTLFRMMFSQNEIQTCTSLKLIIGGGEAWKKSDYQTLKKQLPQCELCNVYGPTEASIHATFWSSKNCNLENLQDIPIGKPIKNMQAFVMDEELNQVLPGVIGELYLSGRGIARGYLNDTELTKIKFIPYEKSLYEKRIYQTGDLACQDLEGNIFFKGRTDQQIKLRGFRVELGEIEDQILKTGLAKCACVISHTLQDSAKIIAYFVPNEIYSNDIKKIIREKIKQFLPPYMIPNEFVSLDKIPMTINQKVDKDLLILLAKKENTVKEDKKKNYLSDHEKLITIWSEILNIPIENYDDNFFDLGGDSLSALLLISKINNDFGINLSVTFLFNNPTINKFMESLSKLPQNPYQTDNVKASTENQNEWPLSDNQRWLLRMAQGSDTINNIVIPFRINYKLDPDVMYAATNNLVKRHEILRSNIFNTKSTKPVMRIGDIPKNIFKFHDLKGNSPSQQNVELLTQYDILNNQAINLEKDPLFTVSLFECTKDVYYIYIFMHHLISDPSSGHLALKHLMNEYTTVVNPNMDSLPSYTSFAEYVNSEVSKKNTLEYQNSLTNWKKDLATDLYVKFGEVKESDRAGNFYEIKIPCTIEESIKRFSKKHQVTHFVTLLSLLKLALFDIYKQKQFGVGINISRRNKTTWSEMIGPLSEQSISVVNFTEIKDFEQLTSLTQNNLLKIYNSPVTIESIYENLALNPEHSLFNVLLDFEKVSEGLTINNITIESLPIRSANIVRRHLSIRVVDFGTEMKLQFRYRTAIFNKNNIINFANRFFDLADKHLNQVLIFNE